MPHSNQPQLITYPDSLGGNLGALASVLEGPLCGLFPGGVHILPPFPSSGDRGFAPLRYDQIDPAFGTWEDIRRIGRRHPLMVDLMVNHISRRSPFFEDFQRRGRASPYADLFITLDKIWPGGDPPQADVDKIFLRKPQHPFSTITITQTGASERVWTTFGTRDWSEQIDLDVHSPAARDLLSQYLRTFSQQGISMVRLDAVGFVIKKPGTSCFMVEPEIYDFLAWISARAREYGLQVLPEVHDVFATQQRLAQHGYRVYNFVLPALVLHTLLSRSSAALRQHLQACPARQVTMLDCHDGIPILPDVSGILSVEQAGALVEACQRQGARFSRILADRYKPAGGLDVHQIACTYYSALGRDDDAYLAARAVQLFAPGLPQVYYVGLLAGENDFDELARSGDNRAINRRNYTLDEVERALRRPVVQRLLHLLRWRAAHAAFAGQFTVLQSADTQLGLRWSSAQAACELWVDLTDYRAAIRAEEAGGAVREWKV